MRCRTRAKALACERSPRCLMAGWVVRHQMLNAEATHDLDTGVCEIAVAGSLDLHGAGRLRAAVLKSLAEQPVTVLLDLNGARTDDPLSLLILPTLERRAV